VQTSVPRPFVGAAERVPKGVVGGQFSAVPDGEIAVIILGLRINRWRKVGTWLPPLRAMPRLLRELADQPEAGLLAPPQLFWSGRSFLVVQYWRSVEALGAYARDHGLGHVEVWRAFNRDGAGTGHVGVYHETYTVPAANIESLYANMPVVGLAQATSWAHRAARRRSRAAERMGQQDPAYVPDDGRMAGSVGAGGRS
jgi:hypothetical protein